MFLFPLSTPRAHCRGGALNIEHIPRDKHVTLGSTEVREVPVLQYYYFVLHVEVVEMYMEIGVVSRPPPDTPPWGSEFQSPYVVMVPSTSFTQLQCGWWAHKLHGDRKSVV